MDLPSKNNSQKNTARTKVIALNKFRRLNDDISSNPTIAKEAKQKRRIILTEDNSVRFLLAATRRYMLTGNDAIVKNKNTKNITILATDAFCGF